MNQPLLVDKWDTQLPARRYLPNGEETTFSQIHRMTEASRLEKAAEDASPELAASNAQAREGRAEEAKKEMLQRAEDAYWGSAMQALRAMGVGQNMAEALGALDFAWPGVKAAVNWRAGGKLFLVLGGPPGTGKTFAACRMLFDFGTERVTTESFDGPQWRTAWAKFARVFDCSRLSYFDKDDRNYLTRLENARLLILDDLGSESMTETWRATLHHLLDKRMAAGRRTCITTNLDGKTFADRYDARLMRRLREHGTFAAVQPYVAAVAA